VVPFLIGEVRRDDCGFLAVALGQEPEEDVGLFGFDVYVPQLIDLCGAPHKSIYVESSVMWSGAPIAAREARKEARLCTLRLPFRGPRATRGGTGHSAIVW
jgi:hypothetical protein